jgi:SagB-type dehydrogenase family enzyme
MGKNMESMEPYRKFLKAGRWEEWEEFETDQKKKISQPPLQKPYSQQAKLIDLIAPKDLTVGTMPLIEVIRRRKSHRRFTKEALTLEELSFLLWATQGVRRIIRGGTVTRRTVPSGGSRHPFETYLFINRVNGLEPGLYRYLALEHKLCFLEADSNLAKTINHACVEQPFVGKGAVVFIWTVIPYRAEWRFSFVAHKMIALDAGHLCQNLYLASQAIGAGTCAIGEYVNDKMDAIVGADGKDEFVIYMAPVGKIK